MTNVVQQTATPIGLDEPSLEVLEHMDQKLLLAVANLGYELRNISPGNYALVPNDRDVSGDPSLDLSVNGVNAIEEFENLVRNWLKVYLLKAAIGSHLKDRTGTQVVFIPTDTPNKINVKYAGSYGPENWTITLRLKDDVDILDASYQQVIDEAFDPHLYLMGLNFSRGLEGNKKALTADFREKQASIRASLELPELEIAKTSKRILAWIQRVCRV